MKNNQSILAKALVSLVDIFGLEYLKEKALDSYYAIEEKNNINRIYFCFEDSISRPDLKPNNKGWTVYATVDVDVETLKTNIIEYSPQNN